MKQICIFFFLLNFSLTACGQKNEEVKNAKQNGRKSPGYANIKITKSPKTGRDTVIKSEA